MSYRHMSALQIIVYLSNLVLVPISIFLTSAFCFPFCSIVVLIFGIILFTLITSLHFTHSIMEELVEKIKYGFKPMPYVSRPNTHVIENGHCKICQISAPKGTKHCRHCNVCISGFDHHCTWLNTCIGSRNYRLFIIFVAYICLNCFFYSSVYFLMILLWTTRAPVLTGINNISPTIDLLFWPRFNGVIWLLLSIFVLVLSIFLFIATAHLLWFHFKLWKTGQSTYNYILNQRKEAERSNSDARTISYHGRPLNKKREDPMAVTRNSELFLSTSGNQLELPRLPPIRSPSHLSGNRIYPQSFSEVLPV